MTSVNKEKDIDNLRIFLLKKSNKLRILFQILMLIEPPEEAILSTDKDFDEVKIYTLEAFSRLNSISITISDNLEVTVKEHQLRESDCKAPSPKWETFTKELREIVENRKDFYV
jgi:hypothetical protein